MGGPLGSPRVLLVEESDSLRTITAILLRQAGFEVDEAVDESHASALLADRARGHVALVIGMDMTGGAAVRIATHAEHIRPELPIVAWTNGPRTSPPAHATWLPRPWLKQELLEAVTRAATVFDARPRTPRTPSDAAILRSQPDAPRLHSDAAARGATGEDGRMTHPG